MTRIPKLLCIALAFWLLPIVPSLAQYAMSPQASTVRAPRTVEDCFKRGVNRYQRGALPEAIADFERALDLALRPSPSSQANADRVRALEPGAAAIYYNRGVARYDQQDYDGALADFDAALKLNPRYVLAWVKRGNVHLTRAQWDAAIAAYDRALRLDERDYIAWNNRGVTRKKLGDVKGALGDYTQAIRLKPDFALAYYNRSWVKRQLGMGDAAREDFELSLKLRASETSADTEHCTEIKLAEAPPIAKH